MHSVVMQEAARSCVLALITRPHIGSTRLAVSLGMQCVSAQFTFFVDTSRSVDEVRSGPTQKRCLRASGHAEIKICLRLWSHMQCLHGSQDMPSPVVHPTFGLTSSTARGKPPLPPPLPRLRASRWRPRARTLTHLSLPRQPWPPTSARGCRPIPVAERSNVFLADGRRDVPQPQRRVLSQDLGQVHGHHVEDLVRQGGVQVL